METYRMSIRLSCVTSVECSRNLCFGSCWKSASKASGNVAHKQVSHLKYLCMLLPKEREADGFHRALPQQSSGEATQDADPGAGET